MKYCVIKNTTKVIDGSSNSSEIMLQNALNAGLTEEEIEILTEEEYQARKDLEPIAPKEPTLEEKNRADIDYIAIMTGVDIDV
ncbi:hypothetical protein Amet_4342 [Alkaliphilus metalliredigens QYMF]|uniref:Uncharacterized protein n=1 Tax=Alkaliphilus metalliredigens (strain QYMF) TaxID=293826 RepID=A6TKE9_ALKMQ|nr:hypothetical protein [Alkaliphilus metalliredigens]ABR46667.1 hypothetical protein Amet_0439 [Alkaliphilus metalliredigens QYMF]ABR48139.1 hypothetical protein Amet_1976 [Alkaliphilus metalliredigens QYMF]ABR50416.1 hypothetical protein Amet_4342 [Alkaliphilus metalliredigens QYMF]